jgi:hypothetical protein
MCAVGPVAHHVNADKASKPSRRFLTKQLETLGGARSK